MKEKLTKAFLWLTAHPLTFSRILLIAASIVLAIVLFIVSQAVLIAVSGWLIVAEIAAGFLYFAMIIINKGRQEGIDRAAGRRRW